MEQSAECREGAMKASPTRFRRADQSTSLASTWGVMATKGKPASRSTAAAPRKTSPVPRAELRHLVDLDHGNPHAVLGVHPAHVGNADGVVVRAMMPDATRCECILADGSAHEMELLASGSANVFGCFIPSQDDKPSYRLRFHFADGETWEREDPYRFQPTIGELDLHLF